MTSSSSDAARLGDWRDASSASGAARRLPFPRCDMREQPGDGAAAPLAADAWGPLLPWGRGRRGRSLYTSSPRTEGSESAHLRAQRTRKECLAREDERTPGEAFR